MGSGISLCVFLKEKKSIYLAESWHTGPFVVARGFSRGGAQAQKLQCKDFLTPSCVGS